MRKHPLTQHSKFKLEEKREELGSRQALINIPLRSMLINAVVPLKDTRNSSGAKRRLTYTSTGSHKSAPVDFDLLVSCQLYFRCSLLSKLKKNALHELTWHDGIMHIFKMRIVVRNRIKYFLSKKYPNKIDL